MVIKFIKEVELVLNRRSYFRQPDGGGDDRINSSIELNAFGLAEVIQIVLRNRSGVLFIECAAI